VVVESTTRRVTHVVVRHGTLRSRRLIVPMDRILGVLALQNLPIGDDVLEIALAQPSRKRWWDPQSRRFIVLIHATIAKMPRSVDRPSAAPTLQAPFPVCAEWSDRIERDGSDGSTLH
jgi:hypothetical protein